MEKENKAQSITVYDNNITGTYILSSNNCQVKIKGDVIIIYEFNSKEVLFAGSTARYTLFNPKLTE